MDCKSVCNMIYAICGKFSFPQFQQFLCVLWKGLWIGLNQSCSSAPGVYTPEGFQRR